MSLMISFLRPLLLLAASMLLVSCSSLPSWGGEDGMGSIFTRADTEARSLEQENETEESEGFFRGLFGRNDGEESAPLNQPPVVEELALDGFAIERVKIDQLREVGGVSSTEESIRFNKRRRLWGAITDQERNDRLGQYFVVDWEGSKATRDQSVKIKFEYRQRETGPQLKVKEITETVKGREQFTEFAVIGEEFRQGGVVTAWKVTIFSGGKAVATRSSFLWN